MRGGTPLPVCWANYQIPGRRQKHSLMRAKNWTSITSHLVILTLILKEHPLSTTRRAKPNAPSLIQGTSSASVRVFWLNLEEAKTRLKEAALILAREHPEIEQIWLFGSLARGEAVPGSDADILILLSDSRLPFLDRSTHYQPDSYELGVDVLAYTRSEFERMRAEGNRFIDRAMAEGICLYDRMEEGEINGKIESLML